MPSRLVYILIGFLICVLVAAIVYVYALSGSRPETARVCFGDRCIETEIADDAEERELGLMHRGELDENAGMLFIFDSEDKHALWMKDMRIPLDMIWVDSDFVVVHIEKNVPPCEKACIVYLPEEDAKYVVEVNAGFVKSNDVKLGDLASITFSSS